MWARKRLDIGFGDIFVGLVRNLLPGDAVRRAARLEQALPAAAQALTCLSVRSGFDLLWQTLALPAGSEVIFSAVTIHDMPRIAAENGLIPVPADLDLNTLAPTVESVAAALTPQTRALVIAHLCGARIDMAPFVEFARQHNLILIEDCAQAYDGPGYTGDPGADVSMFSFGTIKTATAMGGGIFYVRDPERLAAMRRRHADYPVAGRFWFASRLLKNGFMKAVSLRPWYGLFVGLTRLLGRDYDKVINGSVRGFPGPEFLDRIRQRPPVALSSLLQRRLTGYRHRRLEIRTALGRRLADRLADHALCPAVRMAPHNYWVFPLLAADPAQVIRTLYAAGFDATQGQSLGAVPVPPGHPAPAPANAQRFLRENIFLPIYPDLPAAAVDRLADAVLAAQPSLTPPAPGPASAPASAPMPSPAATAFPAVPAASAVPVG